MVRKYLIFVWLLRVVFMLSVWQNVRADGNVAWHSRSVGVTYAKTYATHKASALLYFLMTLERRIKVLHKSRVSLYAEAPPLAVMTKTLSLCLYQCSPIQRCYSLHSTGKCSAGEDQSAAGENFYVLGSISVLFRAKIFNFNEQKSKNSVPKCWIKWVF